MKNKTITDEDVGFYKGYACAAATVIRTHGEEQVARDLMNNLTLDPAELRRHGVDESDIQILMPLLKYPGEVPF